MRRGTEWLGLKPVLHKNIGLLIGRLRKKIGPEAGKSIQTVWGIGYRFVEGDEEVDLTVYKWKL